MMLQREASLLQTIPFAGFRADEIFPGDLDGDGRIEYLCLQSPGIYQSAVFAGTEWEIPRDQRDLYCLTAIDGIGRVLWQYGKPWLSSFEYANHCADQMIWCGLSFGRGQPEIALLRQAYLEILDGATGMVRRSRELDADNYAIVRCMRCKAGPRLLVKNTERPYGNHWYGDPAHIFDGDLNPVAVIRESVGSGHSPRTLDIDGDGDEEILIGYDAYDANGKHLWRLEGQDRSGYDPMRHHVDQMQAGWLGPKGEMRIVYAGSRDVLMGTPDGRLVWKQDFGHPQHVLLGSFGRRDREARIVIFSCAVGEAQKRFADGNGVRLPGGTKLNIAWMDRDGNIVDLAFPSPAWPCSADRAGPTHSGEGILVYPRGCPDGSDAVITRDWGWPKALDMSGEEVFTFAHPDRETNTAGPDGYGVRIGDFDHDGHAEVLIHDRATAWIFRPALPAAGASNHHAKLKPITGQGWYAL